MKRRVLLTVLFTAISLQAAWAQCTMCRSSVEANVARGDTGVAAYLNIGILYLFLLPYLAVALVAFLWYRRTKKRARLEQTKRHYRRKVSAL